MKQVILLAKSVFWTKIWYTKISFKSLLSVGTCADFLNRLSLDACIIKKGEELSR